MSPKHFVVVAVVYKMFLAFDVICEMYAVSYSREVGEMDTASQL